MDVYSQLAESIISKQETVIGPIAIERAKVVSGLTLDWANHKVSIAGDKKSVVDELVEQYKALFGQISVEVCKEAVGRLGQKMSPDQMPTSLR
jgi:hypothetical protein